MQVHPPHPAQQTGGEITVGYLNCRGQTGLNLVKQQQIENFVARYKVHIVNLQEVDLPRESFSNCPLITSLYQIISNNSPTGHGTAVLVHRDLEINIIQLNFTLQSKLCQVNSAE